MHEVTEVCLCLDRNIPWLSCIQLVLHRKPDMGGVVTLDGTDHRNVSNSGVYVSNIDAADEGSLD